MIGVNDTWRRYDSNILTTVDEYRRNIRTAFSSVKDAGWRLIVISPFLLPAQDKAHWREEDLNEKITACKQEAATYADIFIPMDDIFADRLQQNPATVFADDGVHPNALGAQVIAEEWIAAVENA